RLMVGRVQARQTPRGARWPGRPSHGTYSYKEERPVFPSTVPTQTDRERTARRDTLGDQSEAKDAAKRGAKRSAQRRTQRSDGSAAAEPPPRYIANNVGASDPVVRQEIRRVRFQRRQRSSQWLIGSAREDHGLERDGSDGWVRPIRPARCSWRVGPAVGVHAGPDCSAHFSGLERCGSVWACPVCAAVIRAGRADEIGRAWDKHVEEGGSGLFVTLTLRHRKADGLASTLDVLLNAWRRVQTWAAWRGSATSTGWKKRLGIRGIIRATEVTHGANGWHPHSHLLILTDGEVSADEREAFTAWLAGAWTRAASKLGVRVPSKERGVDVRP